MASEIQGFLSGALDVPLRAYEHTHTHETYVMPTHQGPRFLGAGGRLRKARRGRVFVAHFFFFVIRGHVGSISRLFGNDRIFDPAREILGLA